MHYAIRCFQTSTGLLFVKKNKGIGVFVAVGESDLCLLCLAEDVEVDVESIVFECVDSDGLSITHTDADHSYSSVDRAWL